MKSLLNIAIEADAVTDALAIGQQHYNQAWEQIYAALIIDECCRWINDNVGMMDQDTVIEMKKHFGIEDLS